MTIRRQILTWSAVSAGAGVVFFFWSLHCLSVARFGAATADLTSELQQYVLQQPLNARELIAARRQGQMARVAKVQEVLKEQHDEMGRLVRRLRESGALDRVRPAASREETAGDWRIQPQWDRLRSDMALRAAGRSGMSEDALAQTAREMAAELDAFRRGAAFLSSAAAGKLGAAIGLWTLLVLGLTGVLTWVLMHDFLSPLRDMTDRMRALRDGGAPLDARVDCRAGNELGAFARNFNAFMERLQEVDQTKDRFLANMSHEIRTPLNGIIGFLENLTDTELNDQQRQYVRVIQSSARGLLRVLNDILDFSKIAAGKMELESVAFDVKTLAEEAAAVGRQMTRGKKLRVRLDAGPCDNPVVRGDPTRLRQVLHNLVSNAVKFTERGEVCLALTFDQEADGRLGVTFSVSDTGIGIRPDRMQYLFEAFGQADAGTTRRFGGTGLGLCIASNLVSLMGGALRVESRPGEGSRFWFRIVMDSARPEEKVRLSDQYIVTFSPRDLRKFWVLVVDDNPTNLFLMETICQSIGLPYMTAVNGRDAVEKARKHHFDLIFMDIQMPVMDGYTAIREIRKLENAATTQIIALTASAMQEDVEKALGVGSTGFIAKPFERNQLLMCMAEYLGIPYERRLKPAPDLHETAADATIRRMYDFMREQYRISLGEIKMILAQSVDNWRPQLEDLRVFSRKGDWEPVRRVMHQLKGQLGAIGLPEFAESAETVNMCIREERLEGLEDLIENFVKELSAVFRVLEQDTTVPSETEPGAENGTRAGE